MGGCVYSSLNISPTITTNNGEGIKVLIDENTNNIISVNIPKIVSFRKYKVNEIELKKVLNEAKKLKKITCKEIALALNKSKTEVEHWFRKDKSFSIPDANVWFKLKDLLEISTNKFDKSITVFEKKYCSYDKSNRCYLDSGIAPTLTCNDEVKIIVDDTQGFDGFRFYENIIPTLRANRHGVKVIEDEIRPCINPDKEKVYQNGRRIKENDEPMFTITAQDRHGIVQVGLLEIKGNEQIRRVYDADGISPTISTMQGGNTQPKIILKENYRIRRLTPLESWRAMGFSDEDFYKAKAVCSNNQLYKQAGNSIVLTVMISILMELFS